MIQKAIFFECSHPAVFYYLNNYKIPVKTQHIISIMLYSDMLRLVRVIIRLSLTIFKVYTLNTVKDSLMMTVASRNMSL